MSAPSGRRSHQPWRRSKAGPIAAATLTVLAGDAVAVAIEAEVVGADDADGPRVLRTVAAAAGAVVVGGVRIEAGALGRRMAAVRRRDRRGRRGWGRRRSAVSARPQALPAGVRLRALVRSEALERPVEDVRLREARGDELQAEVLPAGERDV